MVLTQTMGNTYFESRGRICSLRIRCPGGLVPGHDLAMILERLNKQ